MKKLLNLWWYYRTKKYANKKCISLNDIVRCYDTNGGILEGNLKQLISSRQHQPVLPAKWFK